jgi:hypothetical protein
MNVKRPTLSDAFLRKRLSRVTLSRHRLTVPRNRRPDLRSQHSPVGECSGVFLEGTTRITSAEVPILST